MFSKSEYCKIITVADELLINYCLLKTLKSLKIFNICANLTQLKNKLKNKQERAQLFIPSLWF